MLISSLVLFLGGCAPDGSSTVDTATTDATTALPDTSTVSETSVTTGTIASRESQDPSNEKADDAVALVRDYYRAIDAREFRKAYAMWGEGGPPGQTFEQFEAGFADTKSVRVETGSPSRVEAAAGSRYVEVPVTLVATKSNGSIERFEGTYTLRRSVVEGGSPEWRLYRAEIRAR